MAARPVRVLAVDDDGHFLSAIAAIFETDGRADVIGTAPNGELALAEALRLRPDVVTMDIDMPVMDGVEATRLIVTYAKVPVVVVSGSVSGERVREALDAGAVAHVEKGSAISDLVDVVLRAAARGLPT